MISASTNSCPNGEATSLLSPLRLRPYVELANTARRIDLDPTSLASCQRRQAAFGNCIIIKGTPSEAK
jgi:hypothetical protein